MTIFSIASLLTALASGTLLILLLRPSLRDSTAGLALSFFIGGGLGLGLTSCLYFVALLVGVTRYTPAIDVGVCLVLGLACFTLFRRRTATASRQPLQTVKRSRLGILLAGIFSVELIAWTASFILAHLREPHGRWDAWLIWNMHARFLFRGGEDWREAFNSGLDWSHWDYPLLLPLSIARGWGYGGTEDALLPFVTGFLFALLTLGLLFCGLALLKGWRQGTLAAMVLMGTPFFILMGASQFADVPLAFFILATIVLIALQGRSPEGDKDLTGTLVLAGLAAGMAAWTKNEGLLFLLVAGAALFGTTAFAGGWRQAFRRTARFLLGALPVLLIVVYFKLRLAPAGDLAAGFTMATLAEKLFDWSRYSEIVRAFFVTGISFTQGLVDVRVGMAFNPGAVSILLLIAYLLFAGIRIDGRDVTALLQAGATLFLMLAGYFFVYVMTPQDLTWHLITSLNRLFLQLWPGIILVLFMIANVPEAGSGPIGKGGIPPRQAKPGTGKGEKHRKIEEAK